MTPDKDKAGQDSEELALRCEICSYPYPADGNGSHQCAWVLRDSHDLMIDEFMRIAACPGADEEIKYLCERAISGVTRMVPVITENRSLQAKIAELKAEVEAHENESIVPELQFLCARHLSRIEELESTCKHCGKKLPKMGDHPESPHAFCSDPHDCIHGYQSREMLQATIERQQQEIDSNAKRIEYLAAANADKSTLLARYLGRIEEMEVEVKALRNPWVSIDKAPLNGKLLLLGWWQTWPNLKWEMEIGPAGNEEVVRRGCASRHGYATHFCAPHTHTSALPDPPTDSDGGEG